MLEEIEGNCGTDLDGEEELVMCATIKAKVLNTCFLSQSSHPKLACSPSQVQFEIIES